MSGGRAADHSDNKISGGAGALFKEFSEVLTSLNLDPKSCSQKAACVLGTQVSRNLPVGLLDVMPRYVIQNTKFV